MEKSIIIAGFGGQGVMVAGQLLSYTACETTDKYVTFFPSYGAEMRGGTANCYVVISDEPSARPKSTRPTIWSCSTTPRSCASRTPWSPAARYSSTAPSSRTTWAAKMCMSSRVDAGSIAYELGNPRVMNLVIVGRHHRLHRPPARAERAGDGVQEAGRQAPEMNPLNEAAFKRGLEIRQSGPGGEEIS